MKSRPVETAIFLASCCACWQMAACSPTADESTTLDQAPVSDEETFAAREAATDADEEDAVVAHQTMTKGYDLPAGSHYANTVVLTAHGCRGTLLTDSWVLTAQHCETAYENPPRKDFVWYDQKCTVGDDTPCRPRNARCLATTWGSYCGTTVRNVFRNPKSNPDPGLGAQVDLWQLDTPIYSAGNQQPYSVAQQIYYGDKNSLKSKDITIVGHCGNNCSPPKLLAMNTYKIQTNFATWSYYAKSSESALEGGDSGGPGYYNANGVYYLTGVTMTQGNPGSQHDLVETWTGGTMRGWIDDTLFSAPQPFQSSTQGLAMAVIPKGAMVAYRSGSDIYFRQCNAEPCDSRGSWSTPGWVTGGATSPPAIAMDAINSTVGARIFTKVSTGIRASAVTQGAFWGSEDLGGSCTTGPAADSRPGTNPPTLDLVCGWSDGNVYIKQRVGTGAFGGWYSLGKPSVGIRSGATPAVVSIDWNTTYVAVVGADGNLYVQPGQGGVGWTGWTSLGKPWNKTLVSVALASYAPERLDVIAIDSTGKMWQRIGTGNTLSRNWASTWTEITRGTWSTSVAPFAASYGWKYGLLNVGGIGTDGNAYIQRYSDW